MSDPFTTFDKYQGPSPADPGRTKDDTEPASETAQASRGSSGWQSVNSTNLANVKYDYDDQVLSVQFHDGSIYSYHQCPEATYDALLSASSLGKFFRANIRDAFTHTREA